MKKYLIFIFTMVFLSCNMGSKVVTEESFQEVNIGMEKKALVNKLGKPYSIKKLDTGDEEYEYIERIVGNEITVEVRHYYFILQNGKVISKNMKFEDEPIFPLERNSYDLQTSMEKN